MIIVSEPSAKATQPERTDRYRLARRRSSAACDDTLRYADARTTSVHTRRDHAGGSVQIRYRPRHPTLADIGQHHPTFPQVSGRLDHRSPGRRSLSGATSANAARSKTNHALAGRADLRDGQPRARAGPGLGWTRCGVPSTSPQGYHTATRGQSYLRPRRSRRGLPPGRRAVGLRQIDGTPHRPSVQDRQ